MPARQIENADLPQLPALPTATYWTALGALLALRLAFDIFAGPLPDEAYYWLWGQHPALSYLDHPPLNAWLQGAIAGIAGWNLTALRLATWLTTSGTVAIVWLRWRRLTGSNAFPAAAVAVFYASPIIFVFSMLTFPDHLLVLLTLLAAHLFARSFEEPAPLSLPHLYLAATVLGLAGLTKYNAVFVGLGVAAAIVATPSLRHLLRSPHLYAAAAISIAMQAPVVYWNAVAGMPSFELHLAARLAWNGTTGVANFALLTVASVAMVGPLLVAALWRFAATALRNTGREYAWPTIGIWIYSVTVAAYAVLCFFTFVQFYWLIVAYPVFLSLAVAFVRSRLSVAAHLLYGVACAALVTANYTLLPLASLVGASDPESELIFGWDQVAAEVENARQATDADFLAASDYRTAALLAFAVRDAGVEALSLRRDQFDIWLREDDRANRDAIILADDWHPLEDSAQRAFAAVEPLATFEIVRFGRVLKEYRLYHGRGFIATSTAGTP